MDTVFSADELRDAARLARDCPVMGQAVALARCIGTDHLEKTLARDPGQDYPVCVGFRGDSPVEYWSEDDPAEPEPFDLADVNHELAALAQRRSPS